MSRSSGQVIWHLNGKKSDFSMGPGTRFYWQHDARRLDASSISLFDNGSSPPQEAESRGLVLGVDQQAMTVTLMHQYTHPARLLAPNQGNMQVLPGGGAFVGWGAEPYFSQFDATGRTLFDGQMPAEVQSYRAYLQSWEGAPTDQPALAVKKSAVAGGTAYVSWNGATQVASWDVLAGKDASSLTATARSRHTGFETAIAVSSSGPYHAAVALDGAGHELGRSTTVKV